MIYIYIVIYVIYKLFWEIDIDSVEIYTLINNLNFVDFGESKLMLKINQDKINLDLIQENNIETNNNKINSIDVKTTSSEDECKVKKFNPLEDIHKRFLFADKSHLPSHFQKNYLPSKDVPIYGNKLVTFEPSSILRKRNLPEMFIELPPKNTNMGKSTELLKAISGADEAIKLYDTQAIKFSKVLSGIKNGTEEFYPNEAKPLMETYVDLVTKLSHQQKVMANEAINQLKKLDSSFSRNLYPVENNDNSK